MQQLLRCLSCNRIPCVLACPACAPVLPVLFSQVSPRPRLLERPGTSPWGSARHQPSPSPAPADLAPECASAYYRYGAALLYQAQDSGDVFGAGVKEGEEEEEEEGGAAGEAEGEPPGACGLQQGSVAGCQGPRPGTVPAVQE